MTVTKELVLEQLKQVREPELHRDIVSLGLVANVSACDGYVNVRLDEGLNPAVRQSVVASVKSAILGLSDDLKAVNVEVAGDKPKTVPLQQADPPKQQQAQQHPHGAAPHQDGDDPQAQARANNPLPDVKRVIAVGAGKGGVGKSTIAVNLAVGLARAGHKVGLLDGDIYGPSLPTLLGLDDEQPEVINENRIVPFSVHGIKSMTLGKLVDPERALIWRGPMAHSAFRQLAVQTEWGELDYLIVDLPPGTGDVPLTMAQLLPLTGAIVICTPQKVAQDDARRAVRMFEQLGIGVLGIVENMSYFIGDDGKEYDIFGRGGAQVMAQQMGMPFLGTVPINMRLRAHSDQGTPLANFENDAQLGEAFDALTRNVMGQISVQEMSGPQRPELNIS